MSSSLLEMPMMGPVVHLRYNENNYKKDDHAFAHIYETLNKNAKTIAEFVIKRWAILKKKKQMSSYALDDLYNLGASIFKLAPMHPTTNKKEILLGAHPALRKQLNECINEMVDAGENEEAPLDMSLEYKMRLSRADARDSVRLTHASVVDLIQRMISHIHVVGSSQKSSIEEGIKRDRTLITDNKKRIEKMIKDGYFTRSEMDRVFKKMFITYEKLFQVYQAARSGKPPVTRSSST